MICMISKLNLAVVEMRFMFCVLQVYKKLFDLGCKFNEFALFDFCFAR